MKSNWGFVVAAYGLAASILLGYWWRVERRIRSLVDRPGGRQA